MRTTGSTISRALARTIGIIGITALVFGPMPPAWADTTFTVTGTASVDPITYGDAAPTYGYSMGGAVLEAGDTWQTEPVCSSPYVQGDPAAAYTITCTPGVIVDAGDNDVTGNYTITYASASLTVDPFAIDVTGDDDTITYGDPEPSYTSTRDALVTGDTWTTLPTCDSAYDAGDPADTYAITCSGGVIENAGSVVRTSSYDITYDPGTLTVEAYAIDVTADDATVTYGADEPSFTWTGDPLVTGDDWATDPVCDSDYSPGDPVGRYTITCTGGTIENGSSTDVTTSYDITYLAGTLEVLPYTLGTAEVVYAGQLAYRTKASTDTAVQATLVASVALDTDSGTAGVQCPTDLDLDIEDARVTFVDHDSGKVLVRDVHVSLVPDTTCEGTATAFATLSTGSVGVEDYTIDVILGGSFTGADNSGQDAAEKTVVVYQLVPTGIAGGLGSGSLAALPIASSTDKGSTGTYADGEDASFIFRFVSSTKKTKPSGGATLTIPQSDGSYYQVKTTAITSVSVTGTVGVDRRMVVYAKASVTWFDGLGGSMPVDATGGTSVQITILDGATDSAAFTVTSTKTSALLFSNHWVKTGKIWATMLELISGSTVALS